MAVVRHSLDFFRGVFPAMAFALAAIADPLQAIHALGFMTNTTWDIEPWARQSIFAGCAFGWLWIWYLGIRRQLDESVREPDMPLHLACRWIARDSVWAARYPSSRDGDWVIGVHDELMSKVVMGRVELFGRLREPQQAKGPVQHITPNDKGLVQWDLHKLVFDEPPTHMWIPGGRVYYSVKLDSRQVRRVWPRRSLWSRLTKRSPIERIGDYRETFRKQDRWYAENCELTPGSVLDWLLGYG